MFLVRSEMFRYHILPHMHAHDFIVFKRVTAKQTNVRTRRHCIECVLKLQSCSELLARYWGPKGHGPFWLTAIFNLGAWGGFVESRNHNLEQLFVIINAFYEELTNSHVSCAQTLCLPCMQLVSCETLRVLVLGFQ